MLQWGQVEEHTLDKSLNVNPQVLESNVVVEKMAYIIYIMQLYTHSQKNKETNVLSRVKKWYKKKAIDTDYI